MISRDIETQIRRTLDMVEYKMRQKEPRFRIDYCVEKLECEYEVKTPEAGNFTICRSYSYRQ